MIGWIVFFCMGMVWQVDSVLFCSFTVVRCDRTTRQFGSATCEEREFIVYDWPTQWLEAAMYTNFDNAGSWQTLHELWKETEICCFPPPFFSLIVIHNNIILYIHIFHQTIFCGNFIEGIGGWLYQKNNHDVAVLTGEVGWDVWCVGSNFIHWYAKIECESAASGLVQVWVRGWVWKWGGMQSWYTFGICKV